MGKIVKGKGVSGGIGHGPLIFWQNGLSDVLIGRVIVLNELNDTVAQLSKASAILSFSGGVTSHGAIVAREFRLPCVVLDPGLEPILQLIVGSEVEVDGWQGLMTFQLEQ